MEEGAISDGEERRSILRGDSEYGSSASHVLLDAADEDGASNSVANGNESEGAGSAT